MWMKLKARDLKRGTESVPEKDEEESLGHYCVSFTTSQRKQRYLRSSKIIKDNQPGDLFFVP